MVLDSQDRYAQLPSQQQLLLRIQHAATLKPSLLLVTGRKGAGKHTIASTLLEKYEVDSSLAWLTCHEKSTTDSLRQQLLEQLVPQDSQNDGANLTHYLSMLPADMPLRWTIVVNQAELMGNQLLVELWGLVEHCRQQPELDHHISIVLFAEPKWGGKIAQEMKVVTGEELPLLQVPALSLDERKQLFVHLQSHFSGGPTDVELSERSLNEQEGLPEEVVSMFAAEHEIASHKDEPQEKASLFSLPSAPPKWALLLCAASLPALFILWWAYNGDTESQDTQAAKPSSSESSLSQPSSEQALPQLGLPALEMEKDSADSATEESLPAQPEAQTITAEAADESHKQRVEVDEALLKQLDESTADKAEPADVVATEKVEPVIDQKMADQEVVTQEIAEQQSVVEASVTAQQSNESISTEAALPEPVKPELTWWQEMPESHFVLQLALMSTEAGLNRFAQQNQLDKDSNFRSYPAKRNGKLVYIGVYGNYATKEQARSAIAGLKNQYAKLAPWPKSAKSVKQEATLLD